MIFPILNFNSNCVITVDILIVAMNNTKGYNI